MAIAVTVFAVLVFGGGILVTKIGLFKALAEAWSGMFKAFADLRKKPRADDRK
ncbi:MAG: hypothetical protein ABI603_04285 [Acidobacteriota bacterium]